jgi:oligopeptide transport system ATP-binding protein
MAKCRKDRARLAFPHGRMQDAGSPFFNEAVNMTRLLEVDDLRIEFKQRDEAHEVVHGISFSIDQGESVALVGESGSGKSVSALALGGLLPAHPACRLRGSIRLEGDEMIGASAATIRKHRGKGVAYIFQEPTTSLHPQFTVGTQIEEVIALHQPEVKNRKQAIIDALEEVGIQDPHKRYKSYPFEMSGGMQQRVMIAMALACRAKLLVADEPTTALDVTIQAQILELIQNLRKSHNMAVLLITHNFGIVDGFADRIMVMYRGDVVEQGMTHEVLRNPTHAYTKGLIGCIPRLGQRRDRLAISNDFRF